MQGREVAMTCRTFRLFVVVAQAATLFTVANFLLILVLVKALVPPDAISGPPPRTPSIGEVFTLIAVLVGPAALGYWWMFRKLRSDYPRRQARSAAMAFAIFSPIPLGISLLLGPIVGGYTGIFLGTESRWVAFSGAVLWIVVMIALMTFIPSLLALRITSSNKSASGV
jgi:hypothetical protein